MTIWARLHAVIGGSMGGMQAVSWAALERVGFGGDHRIGGGAAPRVAFHEVGRQAIMADHAGAAALNIPMTTRRAAASQIRRMAADGTETRTP
jgi:homoserine O-acetyltransferase